jgi:hypothetical protein
MKRPMVSILILTVLFFWIPIVSAEISQDLDPMVPLEPSATVTEETSVGGTTIGKTSNVASVAAGAAAEKNVEAPKKKKTKKSSAKKSSSKKSSKSGEGHSSQNSKKHKKSSR